MTRGTIRTSTSTSHHAVLQVDRGDFVVQGVYLPGTAGERAWRGTVERVSVLREVHQDRDDHVRVVFVNVSKQGRRSEWTWDSLSVDRHVLREGTDPEVLAFLDGRAPQVLA